MTTRPDDLNDPEFRELLGAARLIIEERLACGVATPWERLAVVALHELPDESDEAAVRAWVPSAAFRLAVRTVALSTVEFYAVALEALVDEAHGDVDADFRTDWSMLGPVLSRAATELVTAMGTGEYQGRVPAELDDADAGVVEQPGDRPAESPFT